MDLAIAIRIGSPASTLSLVKTTIESIQKNIGPGTFRFIISLDPKIPQKIKNYLIEKSKTHPDQFEFLEEKTVYWAEFINEAIQRAEDCEYFIKAHDDVELLSPNFLSTIKQVFESAKEPIGWVSFDDIGYLKGFWSPPTRAGWFKDFREFGAWDKRQMFHFHSLPSNWWLPNFAQSLFYKIRKKFFYFLPLDFLKRYPSIRLSPKLQKLLDLPNGPVKCHAPWNMFVLIKMSTLKKIGPAENWATYNALLVDEDWGLRAMENGFWNIWIPEIKYFHIRTHVDEGGNRSQDQIVGDGKRVADLFLKKWGFAPLPTDKDLQKIQSRFSSTLIPWSIGRNSWDWDYLKK